MYYEGREIVKLANSRSILIDDAIVEIWYYVWKDFRLLYCLTVKDAENYIDAMNAQQAK